MVDAGKKHFLDTNSIPPDSPSERSEARWPILSAWHWLVRIPAKEAVFNALRSSRADTFDFESPTDLAYRCVMPAPLGYAVHVMEVPLVSAPTIEEVAILLDVQRLAKEVEDTTALWRFQRPAIMVVTTVRRHVNAWNILAGSAASFLHPSQLPPIELDSSSHSDDQLTPRRRCSFNVSFANWATSSGSTFIRTLRWAIP